MAIADTAPSVARTAPTAVPAPLTVAAVVLILLALTLRLPSLVEPHYYGDEGVFAATAQRLLDGEVLYTGAWDDKPPGVFLVYAVVLKLFGPSMLALRLLAVAWVVGTALVVLAIGRRIGGEATGWLAALLYTVLASLPVIEGNLLLTEALLALPAAVAVLLAIVASGETGRRRDRAVLAAGALLGVAFLFKQVAALDAAAVGLWLLCLRGRPWRDAMLLVAGWLVPVALTMLWLMLNSALGDGLHAVAGFYGIYLGEGSAAPQGLRLLRWAPAALAFSLLLWRRRRGGVTAMNLVTLWFGLTVLGATFAGRPFGHYLVQAVAPFALVMATALPSHALRARPPLPIMGEGVPSPTTVDGSSPSPSIGRGGRGVRAAQIAILLLALLTIIATFRGFWFSHPALTPAYYENWVAWVAGVTTRAEHDQFYSWRVPNQEGLVRAIRDDPAWVAAAPEERTLFVWGEYPWLYPLAGARNPTRYSTSYLTSFLPGAKAEVMRALEAERPLFIVQELEEWRRLPGLDAFLRARYEPVARVDNTAVWRRWE